MVQAWAKAYGMQELDLLPPTTYIIERNGLPMAMLSLITTNIDRAFLEFALGNPEIKGVSRQEAFSHLVQYIEDLAKGLGYRRLSCLAPNDKLGAYYTSLGYQVVMPDLSLMFKELK